MNPTFWHNKWRKNEIGFHEAEANPMLVKYFERLALDKGAHVFVPLCGKTLDIDWLLSEGFKVTGAELSELAVKEVFARLNLNAKVEQVGELKRFSAGTLVIYAGDVFQLSAELLNEVDAIYDRAALVALPADMRKSYTNHLMEITACASQLLLCFDYDQSLMNGPPFSITADEVNEHYADSYKVQLLESEMIEGGFKGSVPASNVVWLLQ